MLIGILFDVVISNLDWHTVISAVMFLAWSLVIFIEIKIRINKEKMVR